MRSCGLPLAVHRHASIAGVMLTSRGAFLWLLGPRGCRVPCPTRRGPARLRLAFAAVHSYKESSLYAPGDLLLDFGGFHIPAFIAHRRR